MNSNNGISIVDRIEMVEISKLNPYENNARLNDNAVPSVMNSIEQFGFKVPIVVTSGYEIVCGHTRVKAAKRLGMDRVPCVFANDLTEAQIKAFRLADNKVSELAMWDMEKLDKELSDIGSDIKMDDFGFLEFQKESIQSLFEEKPEEENGKEEQNQQGQSEYQEEGERSENQSKRSITCPHCGEEFFL